MISHDTLKRLTTQKIRDATVLSKNNRNGSAVYLAGYALEYSLKLKISRTLGFANGFPEVRPEFDTYVRLLSIPGLITLPANVREIRNHDLNKLLFYSGAELNIRTNYLSAWSIVSSWDPEDRYKIHRYSREKTQEFLQSVRVIIKQLG